MKKNTASVVWDLAQPIADELGLILWDVKFVKEGAKWYLRITIDKEEGVSIDDCVNMHHAIDGPLDEADLDEDIEDSDEDEVPEKCVLCPNYCWKCGSCTINI